MYLRVRIRRECAVRSIIVGVNSWYAFGLHHDIWQKLASVNLEVLSLCVLAIRISCRSARTRPGTCLSFGGLDSVLCG